MCYTSTQFVELIKVDRLATSLVEKARLLELKVASQADLLSDKDRLLLLQNTNNEILSRQKHRLLLDWKEENKKRHEAESHTPVGSWIAWGIAGAATVVAGTLSVLYVTK